MQYARRLTREFFAWYERHYTLNISIAAGLFLLQLVHLYWLSADVVAQRLTGTSFFPLSGALQFLVLVVDYTEIPALYSVSLVYINELRKGFGWKPVLYLFFLNSQWLHIFWITDEFVIREFTGAGGSSGLPAWLAWIAILIDYLELPVIVDTLRKFAAAVCDRQVGKILGEKIAD